jgi:UDP-N-acetylmuramyl pentapeptide synthase
MSIHRENHVVESQRLIRPHVVVITNVGLDHTDAMGGTRDEVASVLAECITPGSDVFVPEDELLTPLEAAAGQREAAIHRVRIPSPADVSLPGPPGLHFAENLGLVAAVARHLGAGEDAIIRGFAAAQPDAGQLAIWRHPLERTGGATGPTGRVFVVNVFAANDPRSTRQALDKALDALSARPAGSRTIGLLCLRSDRGDRTRQWLDAFGGEARSWFDRLLVVGGHAAAFRRSLGWGEVVAASTPEAVMARVAADACDGDVLVGLGNLVGMGSNLVALWTSKGEPYGS